MVLDVERIPQKRQNGVVGGTETLEVLGSENSKNHQKWSWRVNCGEKIPKKSPRKWSWKGGNS